MTNLDFKELGMVRDAVRCAIRNQNDTLWSLHEAERRNRPSSYPLDPCEEHFARYWGAVDEARKYSYKLHRLSEKLTDMLKERQPE